MATPPRITTAERDAAIARIAWRHEHVDDQHRSAAGSDPRTVIAYVLGRGPAGIPRWVAAADVADVLVLSTWCWWEDRRAERRLLRHGLHLGLSLAELGAPLGITTRQGVRDRLDRLEALLAFDRPDEQLTRAARRERRTGDVRQFWIDAHRGEMRAVVAGLLAQAHRVLGPPPVDDGADDAGGAREWLEELGADYTADELSPATLAVAGLAVAELRGLPIVYQLDPRHRLHTAVREVALLRSRLAGAGGELVVAVGSSGRTPSSSGPTRS